MYYVLNIGICNVSRKLKNCLVFEPIETEYDNEVESLLSHIIIPDKKLHLNKTIPIVRDDPSKWNYIRPISSPTQIEEGLKQLLLPPSTLIRQQFEYPLKVLTSFSMNCKIVNIICKDGMADCPTWLKLKLVQLCAQEISAVLKISYDEAIKKIEEYVTIRN